MKRRSKLSANSRVYWPQNTPANAVQSEHDQFVYKMLIHLIPIGKQGLTKDIRLRYAAACRWLLESLYRAYYCVPSSAIALPLSKGAYSTKSTYGMPFGYAITTEVLRAAERCQFISVQLGVYVPNKKGLVTRARPEGRLLQHFIQMGTKWELPLPPAKEKLIYVNEAGGGSLRRIATNEDSKRVNGMRLRLNKINHFLSKQCIWIDLPDRALAAGFKQKLDWKTAPLSEEEKLQEAEYKSTAISLTMVHLRRIFTQNSLEKGGRLYGGWWQLIPSKLRRRIMINDDQTIELDYSGLALNMLYALEKTALSGDPYDIGLHYTGKDDAKRRLVKRYVNAVLNDASGKYKLSMEQLAYLQLSHEELASRVRDKHAPIARHFNSGIGVTLQYHDSEMAEKVINLLNAQGITCLPIHDSFIVPLQAYLKLEIAMKATFQDMFGFPIDIKETVGFCGAGLNASRQAIASTVTNMDSLISAFIQHRQDYEFMTTYLESWRSANFSQEDIGLQLRALNIRHRIFKDQGLPSPYEHCFQGLYPLTRHL